MAKEDKQIGSPNPIRIAILCIVPAVVIYWVLLFSGCSEPKKETKENDTAAAPSSAVTKQTAQAGRSDETDKSSAPALPERSASASPTKVKDTSISETSKTKEALSSPAAKPQESAATAKVTKNTVQEADPRTKSAALSPETTVNKPPSTKSQDSASAAPPKQDLATSTQPAPAQVASPLRLTMNIIGQRKEADGRYTEILVSEGSVLQSRDNFQIHFETDRPAYVAILMYDSHGKASQIFPEKGTGYVEAGKRMVLPPKDLWFWLDENTGTETIYVLASEKPMSDISGLLAKMEGGDDVGQKRASQEIKQRIAVMQRGVGGIVKGNSVIYTLSDGKKIQKVTDVVTGSGSVVRAVSFQHR